MQPSSGCFYGLMCNSKPELIRSISEVFQGMASTSPHPVPWIKWCGVLNLKCGWIHSPNVHECIQHRMILVPMMDGYVFFWFHACSTSVKHFFFPWFYCVNTSSKDFCLWDISPNSYINVRESLHSCALLNST